MNLDSLHRWLFDLCKNGETVTVTGLMAELAELRQANQAGNYGDLPADGISMQQALERLLVAGKATRDGNQWRYAEPKPKAEPQRKLF